MATARQLLSAATRLWKAAPASARTPIALAVAKRTILPGKSRLTTRLGLGLAVGVGAYAASKVDWSSSKPAPVKCEELARRSRPRAAEPEPESIVDVKQLSFSAGIGIVAGFLIVKGLKTVALVLGGAYVLLQYLASRSIVKVDWSALGKRYDGVVGGAAGTGTSNRVARVVNRLTDFLVADFPPRATFACGLALGMRLGLLCSLSVLTASALDARAMHFESAASPAPPSAAPDVRPVVLAGPGLGLYPLTDAGLGPTASTSADGEASTSSHAPVKALLPVGNRPMIEGVLRWIEDAGLNDVLILAFESQQTQLAQYLRHRRQDSTLSSNLRIDLQCAEDDARTGTATLVGWAAAQGHLKSDFLVLPCDLLLAPAPTAPAVLTLSSLIDAHRGDGALVTSLLFERAASNEDKSADNAAELLTILERSTATLLDVRDWAEYEDEVELRSSLFARHPNTFQTLGLLPAHVYVCSSRVLAFIRTYPELRSFRDDLVPWLCRSQWQRRLLEPRLAGDDGRALVTKSHPLASALARSSTAAPSPSSPPVAPPVEPPASFASSAPPSNTRPPLRPIRGASGSTYAASTWSVAKAPAPLVSSSTYQTKCAVRIWRAADGFCARGNTIASYAELNRTVLKNGGSARSTSTPAGLGSDSIAGAHLVLGEKASVKRSTVGKDCSIAKLAKIASCVLMDRVVVGEGAKLDNCIVGPGARIGDRAQLKDCTVAPNAVIEPEANLKGESILADE